MFAWERAQLKQRAWRSRRSARSAPSRGDRGHLRAWAELAGLWSFAVAYPMLQNVSSGPEALTHLGVGVGDLVLAVGIVVLVPPTALLGLELAVDRLFRPGLGGRFHAAVIGLLAGLVAWRALREAGLPEAIGLAGLALVTVVGAWVYLRASFARAVAGALSIAVPAAVAAFVMSEPVRSEIAPHPNPPAVERISSDVPVVLVVFDEWPLATIESSPGEIDEALFPGMAELARQATWYPNAITDARMTRMALPVIMSGLDPDPEKRSEPPSSRVHPANLCTVLEAAGYEVAGMEPYSNFCGGSYGRGARIAGLLDLAGSEGIAPAEVVSSVTGSISGLYPPVSMWSGREERLRRAIGELEARPGTFNFIHSLLPHFPWRVGPAGQEYELPADADAMAIDGQSHWVDIPARIDYSSQRMLLQAQFADRMVAAMIERLRDRGEWEESMIIVTADHGATIRPGESRRGLTEEAFASIGSIPLFVKLPGQRSGFVDRSFVRTADIAPTVYRRLGVDSALDLDGEPLPSPGEIASAGGVVARQSPELPAIQAGTNRYEVAPAEFMRQRRQLARDRNRLFGAGTPYALGGRADLLGRPVEGTVGLEQVGFEPVEPEILEALAKAPPDNMAVLDAVVDEQAVRAGDRLVVAHAGLAIATSRAYRDAQGELRLTVVLPPSGKPRAATAPLEVHRDSLPGRWPART